MTREEKISQLHRVIFQWYKKNGRKLPWRETKGPYRILVSELMLQQTQVERVLPKYREFLKIFPTVRTLASAPLRDVLTLWSGLGYNRRAKYLHETAKVVVNKYKGKFPREREILLLLPGIGPSTASALMSFAYDMDEPMIDTNVRRVLRRIFFPNINKTDPELYIFAKNIIPKGKGRIWNWAVMDIAALYCKAVSHNVNCPLMSLHGKNPINIRKIPQKKFVGSDRYYRGAILRMLSEKGKTSVQKVSQAFDIEEEKICRIVKKMEYEGLLMTKNEHIFFPNDR